MPLSVEERVELLKKAREIKAQKKAERDALKPKPKMGRPPKKVVVEDNSEEHNETLDDSKQPDIPQQPENIPQQKEPDIPIENINLSDLEKEDESDPEIIEEVVKKKKKKKKIIRRIIEQSSSSDDDIIEEIHVKKNKNIIQKNNESNNNPKVVKNKQPEPQIPKQQEIQQVHHNPFFCY